MRAIFQRVTSANVKVDEVTVGAIEHGWMVLLGVGKGDDLKDVDLMVDKILNTRAFSDSNGQMNLSLLETGGAVLLVSQFTLWGDCRKGRRPGFTDAAPPDVASSLYEQVRDKLIANNIRTATGKFQTHMSVQLTNDGPVTLMIDTRKNF